MMKKQTDLCEERQKRTKKEQTAEDFSTEFSRMLGGMIKESTYSIYKISQMTGLGRTAIQHALTGRLLPGRSFVESICKALMLTPAQTAQLKEAYFKVKIGKDVYDKRQSLINAVGKIGETVTVDRDIERAAANIKFSDTDHDMLFDGFDGYKDSLAVIYKLMTEEADSGEKTIYTTLPLDSGAVMDMMSTFVSGHHDVNVKHFIRMYKDENGECNEKNLELMYKAVNLSLHSFGKYEPYCFYSFKSAAEDIAPIFPYIVVTSKYTAEISADFQYSHIMKSPKMRSAFIAHINKLFGISEKFIDFMTYTEFMDKCDTDSECLRVSIQYDPCVMEIFSKKEIDRYISDKMKDSEFMRKMADKMYTDVEKRIKAGEQKYESYCFFSGIKRFIDTGKFWLFSEKMSSSFDAADRLGVLYAIKENDRLKLIDDSKYPMSNRLEVDLFENRKILIISKFSGVIYYMIIREPYVYSAFEDLMLNLSDHDFVIGNEKKKELLDKYIQRLEGRTEGTETADAVC